MIQYYNKKTAYITLGRKKLTISINSKKFWNQITLKNQREYFYAGKKM
jgi:hypothetical protein